jgi:hypothetical protein
MVLLGMFILSKRMEKLMEWSIHKDPTSLDRVIYLRISQADLEYAFNPQSLEHMSKFLEGPQERSDTISGKILVAYKIARMLEERDESKLNEIPLPEEIKDQEHTVIEP